MEAKQKKAILLMLLCACLWSIAGIFIKLIPWNGLVIAGGRSLLAAFVMLIYMLLSRRRFVWNRWCFISAVLMSSTLLAFVCANKLTTAANAIVLQYTAPIFVLIFSALFFHQRFHWPDVAVVLITLVGMSLFFFDSLSSGNLFGNLLAIFAGVCFGGMMIASAHADDDACMTGILFGHLLTALIGLPFAFVFETPVSTPAVLSILVLGVVQLGIPYVLFGLATRDCPPLACSLLSSVEPLLNPIWVFIFTGEAPGVFALVGAAIVLCGVTGWCVLGQLFAKRSSDDASASQ